MIFEFATATRLVFEAGAAGRIAQRLKPLGRRALVVTGRHPQRAEKLLADLAARSQRHDLSPWPANRKSPPWKTAWRSQKRNVAIWSSPSAAAA